MAAKKKSAKINKAPSGVSFMYEPRETVSHVSCPDPDCDGMIVESGFQSELQSEIQSNRSDALVYVCTACDWTSPDGFEHEPTKRSTHHVVSEVVKKQKPQKPNVQLRNAVRAEAGKRMARLIKARKAIRKPSSKLTSAERDKLHKLSFSIVEIRDELKS